MPDLKREPPTPFVAPSYRATVWAYLWPLLLGVATAPLGDKSRLLAQLVVQAWVRYPLLRLLISAAFVVPALGLALGFAASWLTYREWILAQMLPVTGRLSSLAYDDLGRLVIRLDSTNNPFIAPAWAGPLFPADRFSTEVAIGDPLTLLIDRDQQAQLGHGGLLVAHEIRSERATYLSFAASSAARHAEFTHNAPGWAGGLLVVGAFFACTLAFTLKGRKPR